MNEWKDWTLEKPKESVYVLLFYKNKPIVAYHQNGVWYDYLEYKIHWIDSIRHWKYIEEPDTYNGYD